jgi:heat shock protein HslJ
MVARVLRLGLRAAVVGLAAVGCGGGGGEAVSLEGTSWVLESMAGTPVLEGVGVTVSFTGSEVSGSGGCNLYGGTYELEGEAISIGEQLASTLRACLEEGRMEQESAYLGALASAERVKIEGETLVIETAAGPLRYRRAS